MYPGRHSPNSNQYGSGAPGQGSGFRMPSPLHTHRDGDGYAPPPQPPARYDQYDLPPRTEDLPIGYFPSYEAPPGNWPVRSRYAPPPLPPNHPPSFAFTSPPGPPPDASGPGQYTSYRPPQGPPPPGRGHSPHGMPPPPRQYGGGPPSVPQRPDYGYRGPSPGPAPLPPTGTQNYGPQIQGPGNQSMQPYFEYSRCTGKKRALCIGINYFGQDAELKGCINDARNVQQFLLQYGFTENEMVILTDDARNPRSTPTRQNMLDAMQWLVKDAQPNDSLFFHYSGHGGRTKDLDGDEPDGFDDVIYPVDFQVAGHIVDDDMHAIMVRPLPPGCRLTAIYDCCHSGSALDLPYTYSTEGKIKEPNLTVEAGKDLFGLAKSYALHDVGGMMQEAKGLFKLATGSTKKATEYARATKTSPADVISWSGCKDTQTSADAFEAGRATGAMSYAFITCLTQQPNQSYQGLLINLREMLRQKYSQKPQLSSSHPIDTNLAFLF